MIKILQVLRLVTVLGAAAALVACGGGGTKSVSTATATNVRYAQTMTVSFSGQGLDAGVQVRFSGPCENPQNLTGATSTAVQFSCKVNGVGRIHAELLDSGDSVVLGSLAVDVPLPRVTMSLTDGTRTGQVVIELDPRAAPKTVEQFIEYTRANFYASTLFHRVNPQLAILGGGFVASGTTDIVAKAPTRPALNLERTGLRNLRGTVAMYREADPNSANSMFFINTVDNPAFDPSGSQSIDGYAVFGQVVSGLDVVDEAAKVPVRPDLELGLGDVPATLIRIASLQQTR